MNRPLMIVLAGVCVTAVAMPLAAQGLKGGSRGGSGGGNRAAPSRPSGGGSRPAPSRPSGGSSRPSAGSPNLGGGRPSGGRPSVGSPSARPSPSRPSVSRPPVSRPSPGGSGSIQRPGGGSIGGGSIGGLKPGGGSGARPPVATLPSTRPGGGGGVGAGGGAITRPSTRPGTSGPTLGATRPSVRPSLPDVPNAPKPGQRPGGNARPDPGDFLGINRPVTLPSTRPSPPIAGIDRPGRPGENTRPTRPGENVRPGIPGDTGRPGLPGDIGRPGGAVTLPGQIVDRPGRPGGDRPTRPGDNTRPWNPGDNDRPWRPGDNNRPGRPGDINRPDWNNRPGGNNVIHNRPSWVRPNNINNVTINNQWNNAFLRPTRPNWWVRPVGRPDRWNTWGGSVRRHWNHWPGYNSWFGNSWWHGHPHALGGWHYGYGFARYPSYFWWRRPAWNSLATWFVWNNAPPVVWAQPVYYDYGPGGNVVYNNNVVYVGGQPVASAASYAMSAAELATVPPPETEEQAEQAEWMPLGTFAVSSSEEDVDPNRVLQLAVSKTGIISGTLFNPSTDVAQSIQGKVDENTQRVAFRIGENDNVVVETGLGNLSQNEAAALVHYGPDQQETWLLVRLDNPDDPDQTALAP